MHNHIRIPNWRNIYVGKLLHHGTSLFPQGAIICHIILHKHTPHRDPIITTEAQFAIVTWNGTTRIFHVTMANCSPEILKKVCWHISLDILRSCDVVTGHSVLFSHNTRGDDRRLSILAIKLFRKKDNTYKTFKRLLTFQVIDEKQNSFHAIMVVICVGSLSVSHSLTTLGFGSSILWSRDFESIS